MTTPVWDPAATNQPAPQGGLSYGWWLAAIGTTILVVATAPLNAALPILTFSRSQQVGWTALHLGLVTALSGAVAWVAGPIAGWGVDKIGPRKMVMAGMLLVTAGWILFSRAGDPWLLFASSALIGFGAGLGAWIPVAAVLNNWFRRRLCTAMAIPGFGAALGVIGLAPLTGLVIASDIEGATTLSGLAGWQAAALVFAAAGLAVSVVAALAIRDHPQDPGATMDGIRPDDSEPLPEYTWREAIKTRTFWLLALGAGCFQAATMIAVPDPSSLGGEGNSSSVGLYVSLTYSIAAVMFHPVAGLVGDRMPIRHALLLFVSFNLVGDALLLANQSLPLFWVGAALAGMGAGGHGILAFVAISIYFGRSRFGSIVAFSAFIAAVGNGAAAFFSVFAGGQTWFHILALVLAAVAAAAYRAIRPPVPSPSQRATMLAPVDDG